MRLQVGKKKPISKITAEWIDESLDRNGLPCTRDMQRLFHNNQGRSATRAERNDTDLSKNGTAIRASLECRYSPHVKCALCRKSRRHSNMCREVS